MENTEQNENMTVTDSTNVKREKVRTISISAIEDAKNHPFNVKDDTEMKELMDSISKYAVITPCVVRKIDGERYEMISGHRRKRACQLLGLDSIPVIIREMTEDEAVILMVDANLQREHILPSEKAFAYKMKLEAIKKVQGRKAEKKCAPLEHISEGKRSRDIIAEENGDSREQVRRFIRLTLLIPELLEAVDQEKIAFRPAVELSYLTEDEQKDVSYTIDMEEATPSLAQAIQMKSSVSRVSWTLIPSNRFLLFRNRIR